MSRPMAVRRVHTEHGSHVEPPLDESWSKEDKLRWHAALVAHDTGLRVEIHHGSIEVDGIVLPDTFTVIVGYSSTVQRFDDAWTYLHGVSVGARAARAPEGQQG